MKARLAVPDADAGTATVPVLMNLDGVTQHASARITAPGSIVRVPEFVIAGPVSWIDSRPGPAMSVAPSKVIGAWLSCSPRPLNDASPCTVSGTASVLNHWLTLQEKLPITVTSPPDSDVSVSVRSCSWIPPGTPDTTGLVCDGVGAMVTLSPFCGTWWLAQFSGSPQLEPSPSPVQVWLADALAAMGARTSVPVARMPADAATAIRSHSFARADAVMITSHGRAKCRGVPWGKVPERTGERC